MLFKRMPPRKRYTYSIFEFNKSVIFYGFFENNIPISFGDAMKLLNMNKSFRSLVAEAFKRVPFKHYMFGFTKINSEADKRNPFKIFFKNSPEFKNITADPEPFLQYFQDSKKKWTKFLNIGRDTLLLVPCPPKAQPNYEYYKSIGDYVENHSSKDFEEVLKNIGYIASRLKAPMYINTHGFGVHWLHIRIDTKPKYCTWFP